MRTATVSAAVGLAMAAAGLLAAPALSSAFWGATVINVAYNDVLNARRWPSPSSRVVGVYNNGDHVSLTGKCRSVSGGWSVNLDDAPSWPVRRAWVKKHWCEVYHNDGGIGWVRGKFVKLD